MLNRNSPFHEIAQWAIATHYRIPYATTKEGEGDAHATVYRPQHGGVHVSQTALFVDLLIERYRAYRPELLKNPDGQDLSEQEIKLLKLAAIYHDSANISEARGDPAEHAKKFTEDMLLLGFTEKEIELFADAIEKKDSKEEKTIYQKIIHDADCLEIIRMLDHESNFHREYLDITKDITSADFLAEMETVICRHFNTYSAFKRVAEGGKIGDLHRSCELAENCYLAVEKANHRLFLNEMIFSLLKQGISVTIEELEAFFKKHPPSLSDLYCGRYPHLEQFFHPQEESAPPAKTDICFVRMLRGAAIEDELDVLSKNKAALARVGIKNVADLKQYLAEQEGETVFTPKGFKWRPCSLLVDGIPSGIYTGGGVGVMIDPALSTPIFFYKRNVGSARAATGSFEYEPEKGFKKNKTTIAGLVDKLHEMDDRRTGNSPDNDLHYFGQPNLSWTEVLSTYDTESVTGIVVGDNEQSAKDALFLRARLGRPLRPFYRHTPHAGLQPLPLASVIQQSGINSPFSGLNLYGAIYLLCHRLHVTDNMIGFVQDPPHRRQDFFGSSYNNLAFLNKKIIFDLSGFSQEQAEIIIVFMNQLVKKFHPKTENDVQLVTALQTVLTSNHLEINIECFAGDSQALDLFILQQVIKPLDWVFTQHLSREELASQADVAKEAGLFNVEGVQAIACVTRDPFKYQFQHPDDLNVTCVAWVKAGKPIVEYHYLDGNIVEHDFSELHQLTTLFVRQQVAKLNAFLSQEYVKSQLNKIGIENLQFSLSVSTGKCALVLNGSADPEEAMQQLIDMLPLAHPEKTIKKTTVSDGYFSIALPEVQNVDLIYERLYENTYQDILSSMMAISSSQDFEERLSCLHPSHIHVVFETIKPLVTPNWPVMQTLEQLNSALSKLPDNQLQLEFYLLMKERGCLDAMLEKNDDYASRDFAKLFSMSMLPDKEKQALYEKSKPYWHDMVQSASSFAEMMRVFSQTQQEEFYFSMEEALLNGEIIRSHAGWHVLNQLDDEKCKVVCHAMRGNLLKMAQSYEYFSKGIAELDPRTLGIFLKEMGEELLCRLFFSPMQKTLQHNSLFAHENHIDDYLQLQYFSFVLTRLNPQQIAVFCQGMENSCLKIFSSLEKYENCIWRFHSNKTKLAFYEASKEWLPNLIKTTEDAHRISAAFGLNNKQQAELSDRVVLGKRRLLDH